MKKSNVDKAIELFTNFRKSELKEFGDRLLREHSIFLITQIPTSKVDGFTDGDSYLLKTAKDLQK
jgi:hypothetical protein